MHKGIVHKRCHKVISFKGVNSPRRRAPHVPIAAPVLRPMHCDATGSTEFMRAEVSVKNEKI